MGNTADLEMVQKMIIDTLHNEGITEGNYWKGGLFKECCIKAD